MAQNPNELIDRAYTAAASLGIVEVLNLKPDYSVDGQSVQNTSKLLALVTALEKLQKMKNYGQIVDVSTPIRSFG